MGGSEKILSLRAGLLARMAIQGGLKAAASRSDAVDRHGATRLAMTVFIIFICFAFPAHAEAPSATGLASAIKKTGLPLPRFASLRSDDVNMRSGPGTRYPMEWHYRRKGFPVEITAEFDKWRRIRDIDGTEGWVHQSNLSPRRGFVVIGKELQNISRRPNPASPLRAQAEPGVLGEILKCEKEYCKVEASGVKGYIRRDGIWGIYPGEKLD
jgi:SH3-like domain-containing protein